MKAAIRTADEGSTGVSGASGAFQTLFGEKRRPLHGAGTGGTGEGAGGVGGVGTGCGADTGGGLTAGGATAGGSGLGCGFGAGCGSGAGSGRGFAEGVCVFGRRSAGFGFGCFGRRRRCRATGFAAARGVVRAFAAPREQCFRQFVADFEAAFAGDELATENAAMTAAATATP
ncbi:MAG TPA: hypothetical protein VFB17_03920 [Gaiellaceae bacterium]|nr:hypothetical protein [Gaiellaceae bacterium]